LVQPFKKWAFFSFTNSFALRTEKKQTNRFHPGETMKSELLLIATAMACFSLASPGPLQAQPTEPVAKWSFNRVDGTTIRNSSNGAQDRITGLFLRVPGVSGQAIRFDGDTTSITEPAATAPRISGAFSIDAWIVVNTYPWNWVPIVDQRNEDRAGCLFGIDSFGHLGFQVAVNGQWRTFLPASNCR